MKNNESNVKKILDQYTEKEHTAFDELKELDKKVKRPAHIFGYTYGTAGALILGAGMCLAMEVIGSAVIPGIVIGCVGIAMMSSTYALFSRILSGRRKKYSDEVIRLSDCIMKSSNN